MISRLNKVDCCYCGACGAGCPRGSISYVQDREGFYYPEIDMGACTECGQCERVCPPLHPFGREDPIGAFACKHKEPHIRRASSSGGVFHALAEHVINRSGVVFGAVMDAQNQCIHTHVTDMKDLPKIMGSKYVQSYLGDTFHKVKEFLSQSKLTLFCGTPCQVAGLKHFLGINNGNIIYVDLICHGVPSPGVLNRYREYVEGIKKIRVKEMRFRHKDKQWNLMDSMVIRDEHDQISRTKSDQYLSGFLANYYLRPSCGECKANGYRSGADITLGDYWGGCLKLKEFDDGQGVSAVIIRSAKGAEIYGEVSSGLDAVPADIAHIARFNHNLEGSSKHHPGRAAFFDDYRKGHNFKYLAEKHIRRRPALILKRTLGAKTLFWLYDICKK